MPRISRAMPRLRRLLGSRVRTLRGARGLTIAAVARATGISPGFLDRFEQGRTSISLDALHEVAVALDVPVSLLLQIDLGPRRRRGAVVAGAPVDAPYRRATVMRLPGATPARRKAGISGI